MSNRRSLKHLHKGVTDFAIYAIGLFVVVIGAAVCYVLAILGKVTSKADAALAMTIVATVGFTLVTAGVVPRAHRRGREIVGPLIFGIGLFVALTSSLTIYTLVLYQIISEESALLGLTSTMIQAVLLVGVGVVWRAYRVERKEARRVVMKPLRKIHTRRVDGGQGEQNE